jgi:cellulose synthase operon protein C
MTRSKSVLCKTIWVVALSILLASKTKAGQFADATIPGKWLTPLLPEKADPPPIPDYDQADLVAQARIQLNSGQYRRALQTLNDAPKAQATQIALIAGKARLELGRYDEALAALTDPDPAVQTLRANVLTAQGKYADAIALLRQIIQAHPDLIPPRFFLGDNLEKIGDEPQALAAYNWFLTDPHNYLQQWIGHPETFNSAEDVVLIGRAVDRWATLSMAYQGNRSLHDVVLSMFVQSYDLIDRDYWPAHVAAAQYLLLHDDAAAAMQELGDALAANPSDISAWKLLGKIQLENFNFDAVDAAVAHIRRVNPDSIDADMLEARNLLRQRVAKQALPLLERVLEVQPHNIEALGLLAGTYALLLEDDQSAKILRQVDAIDPNNASAYLEVADQLSAMRQYPRAAAMYQIAVKRAPWWNDARNGLGLLYTQSGDEDSARTVLESAHSIDPFNVSTTNYLRLLDMMDHFAQKESAHFIVFYDAQQDPIVPEYFSDYLESVYPAVTGEYKYEPKVKTLIEVFPTHDAFSVRTSGAPWIATVGASTGRVIALVAPRKGDDTLGTFNFSQVLRHEFTHTVTLGATDNRIAHWFTEGLAVQQEHSPVRWEWVPMLYDAVMHDQLFDTESLTWAFVRPRRPIDRQLAYAESSWICQYIEQTYGHEAILRMLDQFRLGHPQDEVFQIALNKSESQFFIEFCQWCRGQVSGWGYDAATSKKYDQLRADGENLIRDHEYAKAVPVFEEIAKIRPMDILPHQRLAGLYMNADVNQPEKAAEQLDILARVELMNNMYAKGAARIYRNINELDKAHVRALQAVYIAPYDADAHRLLADIDKKMGNLTELQREERVMQELSAWQDRQDQAAESQTPQSSN